MKPEPTICNGFQDSQQVMFEPVITPVAGISERIPVAFRENRFYLSSGGQFTVDPEKTLSDLHQFAESSL